MLKKAKIKDLGTIITGKTPSTKIDLFWNGEIDFITPKDIQVTKHIFKTERSLSYDGMNAVASSLLPANAICVSCIGNIGYVGMTTKRSVTNQQINSIICNQDNDPNFVFYLMKSLWSRFKKFEGQSTTISILNKGQFSDIDISLPSLQEQKKIAAQLSCIDEKIELNAKINDNLQQQAQLTYNISFEKADFHDLPSGWRVVSLGDVATISTKAFNPQKEPITALEHYSIPAFDENKFPTFESSSNIKSNKFIIDSSCFLISKLNPTTKRVWKPYCLSERAVCSTEFIVYRAKDNSISDFLYSVIDSQSFTNYMCTHVNGSTGSRQRTTPSETLSYKLLLPSRDVLERFQSMVSPMYDLIRLNSIENNRLKQLREALLQKLMSEK